MNKPNVAPVNLTALLCRAWRWFKSMFRATGAAVAPKQESILCDFNPCGKDAYAFVIWGADVQRQRANVCREHCRSVWEACEPQIKVGICWWIQSPPKTSQEREAEVAA